MQQNTPHGSIDQSLLGRKDDYLYRVSMKSLIRNKDGLILVVKEAGRTWWDLPGGGMDHGETIRAAIARELHEEVGLVGDFTYEVIDVDDPVYLPNANVIQVRLIFEVKPDMLPHEAGEDADEISYIDAVSLLHSTNPVEKKIADYYTKLRL